MVLSFEVMPGTAVKGTMRTLPAEPQGKGLLLNTEPPLTFVCAQVALLVAAEFWEQGDLERTVLDQQPIVSIAPRIFHPDMDQSSW